MNVDSGRLLKFTAPEHDGIPDMVQSWKAAIQNTPPPNNKSKPTWGYFVPDAAMLMAPKKSETRVLYIMNWLKIRVDWLLILIDNEKRLITTATSWREYLSHGVNARNQRHANVLRTMKEMWKVEPKDIARRASIWGGRELTGELVDQQTCREITWELCQVGFRYELWALDSIIVRREGIHALEIAAERIRWINEVCMDDWLTRTEDRFTGAPNIGARTIDERVEPLQALCRLMQAWPNKPEELVHPLLPTNDQIDVVHLQRLETVIAEFYVLTFVRHIVS